MSIWMHLAFIVFFATISITAFMVAHDLKVREHKRVTGASPKKSIALNYTYEMDDNFYVGCLNGYPEFPTQGKTLRDFEENLLDIYNMIVDGTLTPCRRHGVLEKSL